MTALTAVTTTAVETAAYANWGGWVANCPRPWCTNAMQVDRGQDEFVCAGADGCGMQAVLIWPADPDAIEAILQLRPVRRTRNWVPGETLNQLMAENAEHGCIPAEWTALAEAEPGGSLDVLVVLDERVVGGILHHQLEAAGLRREIGA